jgi:hypothetical protein
MLGHFQVSTMSCSEQGIGTIVHCFADVDAAHFGQVLDDIQVTLLGCNE